jgi:ferredoxin-NADP reductase
MSKHEYKVQSLSAVSPTAISLKIESAGKDTPFSFRAGQYAALCFKQHGRPTPTRCFSIVSSPIDIDVLEFGIRVKGAFTTSLQNLKPGDSVTVEGPFGGFVLHPLRDDRVVMLAGGIGITPLLSQIRYATQANSATRIMLVYSCQTQEDTPYMAELLQLAQQNPNFSLLFAIGSGKIDAFAKGMAISGRITPEILEQLSLMKENGWQKNTYFICGPAGFMNAMTGALRAKGVVEDRIITEAFSQSAVRQSEIWSGWPNQVYVLATLGIIIGSAAVMAIDVAKTAPKSVVTNNESQVVPTIKSVPAVPAPVVPTVVTPTPTTTTPKKSTPTTTPKSTTVTTPNTTPAPVISTPAPAPTPTPVYKAPVTRTS